MIPQAVDDLDARLDEGLKRVSGRCDDAEEAGKKQVRQNDEP